MIKPMPFWKIFIYKKDLERKVSDKYKLYYNRFNKYSYCIFPNKIILPFIEPLDLNDLKILLDHEILHLKESGPIKNVEIEDAPYTGALNIQEDWFINEKLDIEKLKKIYRKLNSPYIGLIPLIKKEDALKEIKKLKKEKILKDEYSEEEIYEIFKNVFEKRKSYTSISDFYQNEKDYLREKYFPLFNIESISPSDGPCEFKEKYNLPDWEIKRKFDDIIKKMIFPVFEEINEDKLIGKRINQRFLYDDLYIYPFKNKIQKVNIHSPKICVIMDMSGSMYGNPERIAKALAMSILQNLPNSKCILHNEYYTKITSVADAVVKAPATGDERFDRLPNKTSEWKKCDILLIITDLKISSDELKGLNKILENTNARAKYCLCVDSSRILDKNINCKKFDCSTKEGFIDAIKRISLQYK